MEEELTIREDVISVAKELEALKAIDTLVFYVGEESSVTDYQIITTCTSSSHLRGVLLEIKKLIDEKGYTIKLSNKNPGRQSWNLLDCGNFIVHLMNEESRNYYNLEEKWNVKKIIYSSSSSRIS